ncbi:endonuclease NucS [Microbacterium paraoxydans]|uniref:hypothetical protein n=1 Tax=Microbacterium paraoxydans TaxID=199592 RepID=UPI00352C2C6B
MSVRRIAGPDSLWRLAKSSLEPLDPVEFRYEMHLEEMIEATPELTGERTMIIGRQVRTPDGHVLDLLKLRATGSTITSECKRGRAKADAVGQLVAYGAWVDTLDRAALESIFDEYMRNRMGPLASRRLSLGEAFEEYFGVPMPPTLNQTQSMELIAGSVDVATLKAVRRLRENDIPISVHVVSSYKSGSETLMTVAEWMDVESPAERPISVRAQLEELHIATMAAVENSTSRLLTHIDRQRPRHSGHSGPFFTKGAHADILCFVLLFMPRFTASYVPYSLLEALYDRWVNEEEAYYGTQRVKPAHGFAQQLKHAIRMIGGWRWGRKYWDDDPSLENERLRLLAGRWPMPKRGQHLSGYARK